MNKLEQLLDHLSDSKTFKEIIDTAKNPLENVNIRLDELPPGAGAQTLPNGEIIINKNVLDDDKIDPSEAAKLIHELSHALHDDNYLDRESEKQAFQAQVQFMLERGVSPEEIQEKLLPTFEEYKDTDEAKEILHDMIETSKKKLLASLTRVAVTSTLTFTPEEKQVVDSIKDIAEKLGITVYLAGGLIRDRLLGKENSDLDFVTNKGSEILAKALTKKFKLPEPVKLDRSGATMVHMNGKNLDLIDAEKVFAPLKTKNQTLEEGQEGEMSIFLDDAFRRDLTINSLMYNIHTGELLDPTGQGLSDLQNKIIRTIVDPNIKYRIHAPDMLRALRFYATGGDYKFAPGMLEAMRANAARVTPRDKGGDISARRIERELRKAYKSPQDWAKMKSALAEVGLYDYIGKQIEDVDKDRKGDIDYKFDEPKAPTPPATKSASVDEEMPPVPEICTSCKKGRPVFKAFRTDFGFPMTWWDCPSCHTTGASLFPEDKEDLNTKNASKKEVLDELIDEHEQLIEVLESASHEDDIEEAKKQSEELKQYKAKRDKVAQQLDEAVVQGPQVQIDPGIQNEIKDAVADLKRVDPTIFKGVSQIVALTGGPFGQVTSHDPTVININLNKIKQEVQRQLGTSYSANNPDHKKVFDEAVKRSIVETIAHEAGHVHDFDSEKGTFPGGEGAAETLESKIMNQLQYDKPINFNPHTASLQRIAILTQKVNPKTKKKEWALVSKKDRSKVLEWYGASKPSKDQVQKTEKRVQFFKSKAGAIVPFVKYAAEEEVSTVAVVDDENAILMAPRKDDDKWTLPGGHVEQDETPEQAAVRELQEETSIEVDEEDLQFLGSKTVTKPDGGDVEVHSFLVVCDEEADPTADPDQELGEWTYVPASEGLPQEIKENLHNGDNDVTLQFLGLQQKTATDYAGRPIPDDPVFMGTIPQHNIPMNPNYHGGEVLKKKKEDQRKKHTDQSKETKKE